MLILLSPAKTLDMESPSKIAVPTQPQFKAESDKLAGTLRRYSKARMSELMHLSDTLAKLNVDRYQGWESAYDSDKARPAIHAFRGDVYVGLDADTLKKPDLQFAQKHLRILSGLYGVLRPFDLIQAHRLEMGTALKTRRGKSLYEFWGERLTQHLNEELAARQHEIVVNLASNEYFKSVKQRQLKARLISPVFKDQKNGEYKVISFFAKKARGAMARHLIQLRASDVEAVTAFSDLGYRHDPEQSSEGKPVFLRAETAANSQLA